jgi:hypothetical protein
MPLIPDSSLFSRSTLQKYIDYGHFCDINDQQAILCFYDKTNKNQVIDQNQF